MKGDKVGKKTGGYLLLEILICLFLFSVVVFVISVFLKRTVMIEKKKSKTQKLEENIYFLTDKISENIAHVAAASTRDSVELAKHAESLGVDALAAIPPIYFRLPEHSIKDYWNAMIDATELDFIIYNIPQLSGYALTPSMFKSMLENPKVIGVKNSSAKIGRASCRERV